MQVALINDLAENNWVVDTALAAFGYVNFEETSYWIANTKSNPGIVPPPWATSEPNNPNDECVHILRYGSQPYQWNDAGCTDWTWGWVCETAGPTCPPNCPF